MSVIQSSTTSPLAGASMLGSDSQSDAREPTAEAEDDEPAERTAKPRKGSVRKNLIDWIDNINIAREVDQATLDQLGMLVMREFDIDENSRADWKDKAEKALKFATQEAEEKQYPWAKASNVIFPLITQATLQFAARTYPAIIQNRNVVKGVVWGSDKGTPATIDGKPDSQPKVGPGGQPIWLSAPGAKRKRADRIGEHMSYQLLEEMPEWEPQTDQLLHQIPIIGGAIRKTYRDPSKERNYSLFVSLMDLVWNYHAPSFEAAPRHSELLSYYPHEITEFERTDDDGDGGMFLPLQYGPGGGDETHGGDQGDEDAPHMFVEQHRRFDLDDDGYPEPLIVTVHKRSSKVVRIVAAYDEESIESKTKQSEIIRIKPVENYTLIPFLPSVDGGSYPMGFGHLLRPLNEAINTTLNQMFDAGHLQNAGGGFIGGDLSMASGVVNFQVGKYVRVSTKGRAIRDSVFPLPFQGPSPVLFQLLGVLLTAGKEVASIQDIMAGSAEIANAPPTTILALIEQGMKLYTAIHKRVYRALKSEFAKIYRLNRIYLTETAKYRVGDEWREIEPDDYRKGGGVEPIADPTMLTDMQKLTRAQILMGFKDDPLVNQLEIRRRMLDAANIDRIDEILVPPQPPQPNPMQAIAAQLAIQKAQAELGRTRAAEMKDQTQAFLNLALARAKASEPEMEFIGSQIDLLRLHIESLNTTVKAAEVESRHRDRLMSRIQSDASRDATEPVSGDDGSGVPAMAPQSSVGGLPALPAGPSGQLPAGGDGSLGGGSIGG